jgi:hypothetical protein
MNISKQEAIEEIIKNFNWNRVNKAMIALDWKWAADEGYEIPTIGDLVILALNLLHSSYDGAMKEKTNYTNATGGFYARAFVDEETKDIYELRLSFELCNWDHSKED